MTQDTFVNPYSTGGGGINFEQKIGSMYLSFLLARQVPYGLDGITKEIRFQQIHSEPLDDLVILSERGGISRKLSLQLKHNMRFTNSDPNFETTISDCWKTLNDQENFDPNKDRFGIGVGVYQTKIDEVIVPIVNQARAKSFEDFMISKNSFSVDKQEFLNLLRNKISKSKGGNPTDEEIWKFLRCFQVIYFDLEHEGSKDTVIAWNNLLNLIIDRDATGAQSLFDRLFSIVSEHNPSGGIVTYEKLREICSDIQLIENPNFHNDIKQLNTLTKNSLNLIQDTIQQDIRIDRTKEITNCKKYLETNEIVVLHGEPLVGKSVISKNIALEYVQEGECIWFSTDRMENNSLQSYLHQHNIDNDFSNILFAFKNIPKKCIFLDGLENAAQENKRLIINEILVAVRQHNEKIKNEGIDSSFYWKIIITSRSTDLEKILINLETHTNIQNNTLVKVPITGLCEIEKEEIIKKKPNLNELVHNSNLNELFSRPGILNLACYDNFPTEDVVIKSIDSESQFMVVFWEHVICRDQGMVGGQGTPTERSSLVLKAAKQSLIDETRLELDDTVNQNALSGLRLDGILKIENNRIFFVYDYVEDWIWVFLLKQNFEQIINQIQNKHNSLRILASLRLYGKFLLEVENNVENWMNYLKFLESDDYSPIWSNEWINSIILSFHSEILLQKFSEKFLENENELFTKILRSLRLTAVTYDLEFLQYFERDKVVRYMHQFAKPKPDQWNYMLKFTIENFYKIKGKHLLEFSRISKMWTEKNKSDSKFRKNIYEISNNLAEKFLSYDTTRDDKQEIDYYDEEELRKNLVNIIFNSVDILPREVDEFVKKYILERSETWKIDDDFIKNGWSTIGKELPETFFEIMSYLLCEKLTPGRFGWGDLHHLGINFDSKWLNVSAILQPFYPFLKIHPEYGLKLIETLVNHSTKAWRIREFEEVPRVQTLKIDNRMLNLWGDELVFRWYRFPSVGPNAVTCALLALEKWINEQIKEGVDPNPIIRRLLLNTSSVAMVGLVCSIILANPNKINNSILVSILENPVYWLFDTLRHHSDMTEAKSMLNNSFLMMMQDVSFLKKLANQPHREMNITQLVPIILCLSDTELKEKLVNRIKHFETNIPILYKKPHGFSISWRPALNIQKIQKDCRLWSLHADLDNWRAVEQEGKVGYYFYAPDHFNEEDKKEVETAEENIILFSYRHWAYELLTKNKIGEQLSLLQALDYAKKLIPELNKKENFTHSLAHDFIVNFVAALIIHQEDFVKEKKIHEWCEEIILKAASIKTHETEVGINPEVFDRGLAAALPHLYKQNKNKNIKKTLDKFAVYPVHEVRHIFYNNLQTLWDFEPKLIWKYIDVLIKQSTNTGKLTTCDPQFLYSSVLTSILLVIPKDKKLKENSEYKKLLKLFSELLICTINCYVEGQKEDSNYNDWYVDEWNRIFFALFANALVLDKTLQDEAIPKIFDNWMHIPSLMEEFLRQLALIIIKNKFDEQTLALWTKICEKIIEQENFFPSSHRDHTKEIAGLLIFQDSFINLNWKPENQILLQKHLSFLQKWCENFKENSQSFAILIHFLSNNGSSLRYTYGIDWLYQTIRNVSDKQTFLKNSKTSSELDQLLWETWKNYKENNPHDNEFLKKFAFLVDITAEYEKPYSISIQKELKEIIRKSQ